MPRWSFGRPLTVHLWGRRSLHSVFKQVPESTPKLALSFQKAVPAAWVEPLARGELPRTPTPPPPTCPDPAGKRGPDSSLPGAGAAAPPAPPAPPGEPREPQGPGPLFPPIPVPSASGPLCSHHPQIKLSKRQKLAYSPLKSSSRKKSGSRAQSRSPRRRLSAMSRGAGGPRARGTARIPPRACAQPAGTLLPAPSYHSDHLARLSRHHGDKRS